MARKRKLWDTATKQMILKINNTPLSREDMIEIGHEMESMEPDDRDFEGHAFAVIRVFEADPDRAISGFFRFIALARLLKEKEVLGWTLPEQSDGAIPTHEVLFATAGIQPLIEKDGHVAFERDPFLEKVFRTARPLE